MKTKTKNAILWLIASLCYIPGIVVAIRAGEVSDYRFFLMVISLVLFFALACRSFLTKD